MGHRSAQRSDSYKAIAKLDTIFGIRKRNVNNYVKKINESVFLLVLVSKYECIMLRNEVMLLTSQVMREKMTAITLYTIRYSDKNTIVHLFTRESGRVAMLLPQGMTAAARRRNALFMPLSVLEIEAMRSPGSDIYRLKEVNALELGHEIHSDPMKNAIALFVAELLGKVVIDREDSGELFDFASRAVSLLEYQRRGLGNFHICYMMKLAMFLGIYPDLGGYTEGYGFDMQEAQFVRYDVSRPMVLNALAAREIYRMSRMSFANMHHFKYNRTQRGELLELMLQYYRLHGAISGELKSPDVLAQLFG